MKPQLMRRYNQLFDDAEKAVAEDNKFEACAACPLAHSVFRNWKLPVLRLVLDMNEISPKLVLLKNG